MENVQILSALLRQAAKMMEFVNLMDLVVVQMDLLELIVQLVSKYFLWLVQSALIQEGTRSISRVHVQGKVNLTLVGVTQSYPISK